MKFDYLLGISCGIFFGLLGFLGTDYLSIPIDVRSSAQIIILFMFLLGFILGGKNKKYV